MTEEVIEVVTERPKSDHLVCEEGCEGYRVGRPFEFRNAILCVKCSFSSADRGFVPVPEVSHFTKCPIFKEAQAAQQIPRFVF